MVNRTLAVQAGADVILTRVLSKYPQGSIKEWATVALEKIAASTSSMTESVPIEQWPDLALDAAAPQLQAAQERMDAARAAAEEAAKAEEEAKANAAAAETAAPPQ